MVNQRRYRHTIAQTTAEKISDGETFTRPGGGNDRSTHDDEAHRSNELPDRWKEPIRFSVRNFKDAFQRKKNAKDEVVQRRRFTDWDLLSALQSNLFQLDCYATISDSAERKIVQALGLRSLCVLKKEFANKSLLISLNYEDSIAFINKLQAICENGLEQSEQVLRLVHGFQLLTVRDIWLGIENNPRSNFTDYWFEISPDLIQRRMNIPMPVINGELSAALVRNLEEIAARCEVSLTEKLISADGNVILRISGDNQKLQDFLLVFELESAIFSEAIHTITYDASGAADLIRCLNAPQIQDYPYVSGQVPPVILLDSDLPAEESLNPVLRDQILEVRETDAERSGNYGDHSIQMASIICFGKQLNGADEARLNQQGLTSYAKIIAVMMGREHPILNLYDIPRILHDLRDIESRIKVCNFSANIKKAKEECEGSCRFTYLIDEFLFFHPEFVLIASAGNIENENISSNHHTFATTNIFLPGDSLNAFSVGAADEAASPSKLSRKNSFDLGSISNYVARDGFRVTSAGSVRRMRSRLLKPDALALGENWTTAIQANLAHFYPGKRGTSHATAFASHLGAQAVGFYPELQTGLGVECLLLQGLVNPTHNFEIDSSQGYSSHIAERIGILQSKTTPPFVCDWTEKEEKFIQQRLSGHGVFAPEQVLLNSQNERTIVFEGLIGLGDHLAERIDLSSFISREMIENNQISFDGFLSFRGIPYLKDSLGNNLVNVRCKFGHRDVQSDSQREFDAMSSEEKEEQSGKVECQKGWSSSGVCDYQWGNRQKFYRTSMGNSQMKKILLGHNSEVDVLIKAFHWKDRASEIKTFIKNGLKEFFTSEQDCPEHLLHLWGRDDFDISEVKIPYAIAVKISLKQSVSLYQEAVTELEENVAELQ